MNGMAVPATVLRSATLGGVARIARPRPQPPAVPQPDLQQLLEQARAEAGARGREEGLAQGREEGHRRGYAEGLEAGTRRGQALGHASLQVAVQEATAALRRQEQQLRQLADALESAARAHVAAAEDELVALAFESVGRLLGPLCTPAGVRAVVRQVLAEQASRTLVAVHVHPEDAAVLAPGPADADDVPWRADPAVAAGGCIVRHAAGALDVRLETLLAELRSSLLSARASGTDAGIHRGLQFNRHPREGGESSASRRRLHAGAVESGSPGCLPAQA